MENQTHAQNQRRSGKHQAVSDAPRRHGAAAQGRCAEHLNGGRHGVELQQRLQAGAFVQHRNGIHHGGGVHPQLYAKAHGNGQIAVFGGQAGHDDAHAQAQQHDLQHDHRQRQRPQAEADRRTGHGKVHPETSEHGALHQKVDKCRKHLADGGGQARKVHLAEHARVIYKGVGRVVDAVGKEGPDRVARHIKQERGGAVGRKPGQPAEHNVEDDGGQQRVQDDPRRSQDGLLVQHGKIALDEHDDQVAVTPQLGEVYVKPAGARAHHGGPFGGVLRFFAHKKSLSV